MYIIERRRVVQVYPYNPNTPYKYDRTFYVCCSERFNGKPKRRTLGYFKNAESLPQAIENTSKELNYLNTTGKATYIDYFGADKFNRYKKSLEKDISELNKWNLLLPEWKAEPPKEVPYTEWKKHKPKKTKPSLIVTKITKLFNEMNDIEKEEFMTTNNLQRTEQPLNATLTSE